MSDASKPDNQGEPVTRRSLLRAAAVSGVALPLVAACGNSGSTTSQPPASPASRSASGQHRTKQQNQAQGLASTSQVPVGGGLILTQQAIVLTQPKQGEFKGFSAICTHAGCEVGDVQQGMIICPCHGSEFSIQDGSVQAGPAPSPLAPVNISVKGGQIVKG